MEQEFKVSLGFRLFYGILLLGIIVFFLTLGSSGLDIPGKHGTAAFLFCLILVIPFILMLINVFVSKVTVSDHSVIRTNLFGTKELLCADVKGCRIGQKVIYIDPADNTSSPRITINNYSDFSGSDELISWISQKFVDLDGEALMSEEQKIFQNDKYGSTEAERKTALKKAKTIAIIYSVGGVVFLFAMIPVDNGPFAALLMMAYPLLGVIIIRASGGLTKFLSSSKVSIHPFVMIGMVLPMAITLFKSLNDFEIYSYTNTWLPWLLIGCAMFAMLYAWGINQSLPSVTAQLIMMLMVSCLYGFENTVQLNCVFDRSIPKEYKTTIYNKTVVHGKSTTYTLTLNPWQTGNGAKKIDVGRRRYNAAQIGDTVRVSTKAGLLHVPWFYLSE